MHWQPLLMSIEAEWQTLFSPGVNLNDGIAELLHRMALSAPALPGNGGIFNAYGRVYLDGNHLETAAAEADSPYQLATWIEQQESLLANAVSEMQAATGASAEFRNLNYDGLLQDGATSWGTHENYLLHGPPGKIAAGLLPFLATRSFAGAGGLVWPHGHFVAGTRIELMTQDAGGGTMQQRALFSTAREEPLSRSPRFHRLHLIHGDGNRSQFSLALKIGTTALVVRMLEEQPEALRPLPGTPNPARGRRAFWMQAARHLNRLASPGDPLRADPLALRIQRMYLDACRRYVQGLTDVPEWVGRLLDDWEITLGALASQDIAWLERRLDPWIKRPLFHEYLFQRGCDWSQVPHNRPLFHELALLNQDYHSLDRGSVFERSEAAGLLDQRVVNFLPPGSEPIPFVPASGTRATFRAEFIRQHASESGWVIDWTQARHLPSGLTVEFEPPLRGFTRNLSMPPESF